MDAIRRLRKSMLVLATAAVLGTVPATPALARSFAIAHPGGLADVAIVAAPPPDVHGLTGDDAWAALQEWDKNVVIQQVPQPLPAGVDPSAVVVVSSTWLNQQVQPGTASSRPVVRLSLGTRVPDLTGLTSSAAARALTARGLKLTPPPPSTQPTWVATTQQVPAGTIVEFGLSVGVSFAAPETGPPAITLVAVGLGFLLLLLAIVLGLRATRRRACRRKSRSAAASVGVEPYPGQIVGPDLTERTGSVSVRLEPHADPGTVSLEEVHR